MPWGPAAHHLRPPGHHRPTVPAHDPHQPPALIIIDLTPPHTLSHRPSLNDQHSPGQRPAHGTNVTGYGTRARRTSRLADRKSTRLNSSHMSISYAVFCLKK